MKKILLLIFFLDIIVCSYGQHPDYFKARILKTDSSTIIGFVKKTSESSLSKGIKFINSIDDNEIQELHISDINQIVFLDDSIVFEKVKYVNFNSANLSLKIDEYRLAKKLVTGYANLYKLQIPEDEWNIIFELNNTFVYILKVDTTFYVLDQKEKLDGINYKLYKNYIATLNYVLRDYPDLKKGLNGLIFKDKQIVSLIEKYNSNFTNISGKSLNVREKSIIFHGPNMSYSKLNNFVQIKGEGYSLGYKVSVINPEVNSHISADYGLLMERIFYTDLKNNKYQKTYFQVPIGLTYTFNKRIISPFFSVSLSPCFSNTFTEFFFGGSVGLNLYKKYIASLSIDSKISSKENEFKPNFDNILRFNIGYRFLNNKTNK